MYRPCEVNHTCHTRLLYHDHGHIWGSKGLVSVLPSALLRRFTELWLAPILTCAQAYGEEADCT